MTTAASNKSATAPKKSKRRRNRIPDRLLEVVIIFQIPRSERDHPTTSLAVEFTANLNEYGTGPASSTFVVQTETDGVIWEGRSHGYLVEWMATCVATAQGKGSFAGHLLQLDMVEIDTGNPLRDDFALSGWILDPGR